MLIQACPHTLYSRDCHSVWLLSFVQWEIWIDMVRLSDEKDFAICIAFFLTSFRLMSRLWTPRFKKSVKSSNECRMHCRRGDRSAVLIMQGSVRVYSIDESSVISCLLEHLPKVPNQSRTSKWRLEMIGSSTLVRDLAAAATPTRPLKSDLYHAVQGDWRRWALLVLRFLGSLPRPQADSPSTRA